MQPQVDLESRLATVLMAELVHPRQLGANVADIDDTFVDIVLDDLDLEDGNDAYASYEVVFAAPVSDASPTIEFVRVRDTSRDHVITVEFGREPAEERTAAAEFSAYRQPSDRARAGAAPASGMQPSDPRRIPLPLHSVPYERVDVQDQDRSHAFVKLSPDGDVRSTSFEWFAAEPTEIITDPPKSSRVIVGLAVVLGALTALTIGLAIALYAI